ncbi:DUF995 domain-containing protein [Kaistia defluvii]|uniref:DUF995 domain-containing protein n=1 Tax=Kaistia defluvii TaxID=410841 RepID=A0ABV2R480_9HYPH
MSPIIQFTIMGAALSTLLVAGASAAPASKTDDVTAKLAIAATPMSAQALEALYSGKTWKWKDGGGYFSSDRHRFTGWSQKGDAWSYGKGRWQVNNSGKLCMPAVWYYRTGYSNNVTCFLHREKDGVIYQKPALGGSWYVFQHNPVRVGDEVRKLAPGDRVSKPLARLQAGS